MMKMTFAKKLKKILNYSWNSYSNKYSQSPYNNRNIIIQFQKINILMRSLIYINQ